MAYDEFLAERDPEIQAVALARKGCIEMDFTGKTMKGFVFIEPEGSDSDSDLEYWIKLCLEYNPKAKKSRKK